VTFTGQIVSPPLPRQVSSNMVVRVFIERKRQLDSERQATLSKLLRLERQSRALEEEALEAFRRESELLDEEEEKERRDAESSRAVASSVPVLSPDGTSLVPSWPQGSALPVDSFPSASSDDFLAGFDLSVGFPLVDPGSSGGTPEVSRGS
jgi:hypothetical protein